MTNSTQDFIRRATRLPTPSDVLVRLMDLMKSPDASLDSICKLFRTDPALSTRLLKIANSVFYGLRGQVTSVRHAIVLLGFKTIRSLVVTVWTHSLSNNYVDPPLPALLHALFRHSAASGIVSTEVAKLIAPQHMDDAFLAGLLHDIGRMAIVCEQGDKYFNEVFNQRTSSRRQFLELEQQIFGFNHAQLGAELAEIWGFPEFLKQSARHHHDERLSLKKDPVSAIVGIADLLSNEYFDNIRHDVRRGSLPGSLLTFTGLDSEEKLKDFLEHCEQRFEDLISEIQ